MIISKKVWVVMDRHKKAIACGNVRDRRMVLIENLDTGRILTYTTKKKAEAAFSNGNGFWDETHYIMPKTRWGSGRGDNPTYLENTYGKPVKYEYDGEERVRYERPRYDEMCIAIEAVVSVDIVDE